MSRITTLLLFVFVGLITLQIANDISIVECVPDTTVTFIECNTNTWGPNDPYGRNVINVLDELVTETPEDPDYTNFINGTYGGTYAYGYATCNSRLDPEECFDCLDEGTDQFTELCTYAVGAEVVMVDCKMRYENYPFYY